MAFLLSQLLRDAARSHPHTEAVYCRGQSLTYVQLDAASSGLAETLRQAGIRRHDRVGIHLPKSLPAIAAVYGILKVGAVYVPLDPAAPIARVAAMAVDAGIRALVTTPGRATALAASLPLLALVVLVDDGSVGGALPCPALAYDAVTQHPPPADPPTPAIDLDLACILYTSGSTGAPKGVMHTHRSALTFACWWQGLWPLGPGDRVLNFTPLHFAPTVADLFGSALGRAAVVLLPEEAAVFGNALEKTLREERITHWITVPSALIALARMVRDPQPFPDLKAIAFTGEVFPTAPLRDLRQRLPGVGLWNFYGATETFMRSIRSVDPLPDDDRPIPIGGACANVEFIALREDGAEAAVGEEGELYVRGSGLMRGYWGQIAKTAEVLAPHPLAPDSGERVFRTGDLLRRRADGDYDFLGRADHLVKIRGFRVELGDVEAALHGHPLVRQAAAIAVPHPQLGTDLAIFVVPQDEADVAPAEIKRHLAERLPRYMLPGVIRVVAELPHTSNGKIDRCQLLAQLSVDTSAG